MKNKMFYFNKISINNKEVKIIAHKPQYVYYL